MSKSILQFTTVLFSILLTACGGSSPNSGPDSQATSATGQVGTSSISTTAGAGNGAPPAGQVAIPVASTTPPSSSGTTPTSTAFAFDETARFNGPTDLVADTEGNLYVLDASAKAVRKIAPTGAVSTVPVALSQGHDLQIDSKGNLYTSEIGAIRKIAPDGTLTDFANPPQNASWLTIDPIDTLYLLIADDSTKTGTILTQAQQGGSELMFGGALLDSSARGIAIDAADDILYVGTVRGTVLKFPLFGVGAEFASGSGEVVDLAFDATGKTLYVSRAVISYPSVGACVNTGVCDPVVKSATIDRITQDGVDTNFVASPTDANGGSLSNQFGKAHITIAPDGNLYVAYEKDNTIRKVDPNGKMTVFAGKSGEAGSSN